MCIIWPNEMVEVIEWVLFSLPSIKHSLHLINLLVETNMSWADKDNTKINCIWFGWFMSTIYDLNSICDDAVRYMELETLMNITCMHVCFLHAKLFIHFPPRMYVVWRTCSNHHYTICPIIPHHSCCNYINNINIMKSMWNSNCEREKKGAESHENSINETTCFKFQINKNSNDDKFSKNLKLKINVIFTWYIRLVIWRDL